MSSKKAMEKYAGGVANYRSSEGKCVKVIDGDITEDTCWSKCYSYVITKNIHILNNVKLSVQDGACLFLLNGKFEFDKNEYNASSW